MMELQAAKAPNIRYKESVHTLFTDVIIALLPLFAMAYFYYGQRIAVMALTATTVSYGLDLLSRKMAGRVIKINDFSAVITGLIITLLLPATAPYYVVIAACSFAILIAKQPFGGLGNNIFNPSCAGIAFAMVCWPEKVFQYPKPFAKIPVLLNTPVELFASPASALKVNGAPSGDLLQMFLGNFSGPIGATSILVILSCLFFLFFRRTITWHIPVSAVAAAGVFALLFPRVPINIFVCMIFELFAGSIIFGAVFVATDPVTSPNFPVSKVIFGSGLGVLTMLFRYFGGYEEGFVFAVLIMNSLTFALDRFAIYLRYDLGAGSVPIQRVKAAARDIIEHKKSKVEMAEEPEEDDAEEESGAQVKGGGLNG